MAGATRFSPSERQGFDSPSRHWDQRLSGRCALGADTPRPEGTGKPRMALLSNWLARQTVNLVLRACGFDSLQCHCVGASG